MTKQCTLKESFIETQLDKFQPNWRNGEDITAETKQAIRAYVTSKLPEELKDDISCITDYSIWHMAKKIRERENLPEPKKSNKGKRGKVSIRKASDKNQHIETTNDSASLASVLGDLIERFGFDVVMEALTKTQKEAK